MQFLRSRSVLGAIVSLILGGILLVLVLIPILIIGAILLLGAGAGILGRMARGWFTRAHEANGMLDGRKNVRVRMPPDGKDEPA
jgi:uncharacterized membrane protein